MGLKEIRSRAITTDQHINYTPAFDLASLAIGEYHPCMACDHLASPIGREELSSFTAQDVRDLAKEIRTVIFKVNL